MACDEVWQRRHLQKYVGEGSDNRYQVKSVVFYGIGEQSNTATMHRQMPFCHHSPDYDAHPNWQKNILTSFLSPFSAVACFKESRLSGKRVRLKNYNTIFSIHFCVCILYSKLIYNRKPW